MCPFANATQEWENGFAHLGSWDGWPATRGAARYYEHMVFGHGEWCAAGRRHREIRVRLACSIDEQLVAVDEPETCRYTATLETPLACYDDALLTAAHDALRELGVEPGATRAQTIAAVGALLEEAGLE